MSKLVILRGPSGSGKSTISRHIQWIEFPIILIVQETDRFFTDYAGEYKFNQTMLGKAHEWCRLDTEQSMYAGYNIILANTNMGFREIEPYIELADQYNYETEILRTPGPWDPEVLFKRNVHNVPLDVLKRQIARYQPHPEEKEWSDLTIFNA